MHECYEHKYKPFKASRELYCVRCGNIPGGYVNASPAPPMALENDSDITPKYQQQLEDEFLATMADLPDIRIPNNVADDIYSENVGENYGL